MYSSLHVQHRRKLPLRLACVFLGAMLVSACRMPVVINGEGFLYVERSGATYQQGHLFEIEEDFHETFWPVPAPGHSFDGWNVICKRNGTIACEVVLNEALWSLDSELPLEATFSPHYDGPLELVDYRQTIDRGTRTVRVPADSILLQGTDFSVPMRVFMAPAGLPFTVSGVRQGGDYVFKLPASEFDPEDYWLFVSTVDRDGTLATVSFDFGYSDFFNASRLQPHSSNSRWSETLVGCATADNPHALCSMQTLPYLGALRPQPSVGDIMRRTVVSHPWMGRRFSAVLNSLPPDMLKLFRGITAIVIDADIRPSFFTPLTGAIYIDPQDLWLTPEERATIDWEPDFRSDFGSELDFISASAYLIGPSLAWQSSRDYPDGAYRSLGEIIRPLAYVLIHELAHANDAVPPAVMPRSDSPRTPLDFYFELEPYTASVSLENTYPLTSNLLYEIADVLFWGEPASAFVRSLTAGQVGNAFAQDSANGMYAYSTIYEDTATLVEEVLLYYFFGMDKLESFLDVPESEEPDCTEFTLRWGSINRGAIPRIKERARLVLSGILDEADVSRYLDAMPMQTLLQTGIGLCESLQLLPAPAQAQAGIFRPVPELYTRSATHINARARFDAGARRGRFEKYDAR